MDLEKAFDRVLREVISWAMRKMGVEERLVSAVMSIVRGSSGQRAVKQLYACACVYTLHCHSALRTKTDFFSITAQY